MIGATRVGTYLTVTDFEGSLASILRDSTFLTGFDYLSTVFDSSELVPATELESLSLALAV